MASKINNRIIVDVTNGDVFDEMRLSKDDGKKGRSNTGTYFLCSLKNYDKYRYLFDQCKNFYLDINKIKEYQILFKHFYGNMKDKYLDKMSNFDNYCDQIYTANTTLISGMNFRINDHRYFLRFDDNNELLVKAFRHILYGDITQLVLDFVDDKCYIYPEIKHQNTIFFD